MILLKNGCVHNGRGQVSTTDLLIDGGKIVKIGEHLEAACADVIDAAGMHVFPGFIDPLSDWGILGPGREIRGNANDNDERSDVFTPQLDVKYAFNGRGITRQQIYAFGITAVGVAPSNNNVFGGQMAAFEVHGVGHRGGEGSLRLPQSRADDQNGDFCDAERKTGGREGLPSGRR